MTSNNNDIDDKKVKDNSGYSLTNKDEKFTSRVDSIFGSLNSLEQKHNEAIKDLKFQDEKSHCNGEVGKQKKTNTYINKRKGAPGFVSNPAKWKKYSLKEDGTSKFKGLTPDQLNSKVAADLMDDLQMVKEKEPPIIIPEVETDRNVLFKVPELPKQSADVKNKSYFRSSNGATARCMEAFEFGKNNKRRSNNVTGKSDENEKSSSQTSSLTISFIEHDLSEDDQYETEKHNMIPLDYTEDKVVGNNPADIKFNTKGGKIRKRNIRKPISGDN